MFELDSFSARLALAGIKSGVSDYFFKALALAASLSAGGLLVVLGLGYSIEVAFAVSVFLAALGAACSLYYPNYLIWLNDQEIESGLTNCLEVFLLCYENGASFTDSLSASACQDGPFSLRLKRVLAAVELGSSFREAFAVQAQSTGSQLARRALLQLSKTAYAGKSDGLSRVCAEASSLQASRLREFASKQVLYSMVFVTIAALLPAAFVAFASIGPIVFSAQVSEATVYLVFFLFLPLANGLLLAVLYLQSPRALLDSGLESGGVFDEQLAYAFFHLASLPRSSPPAEVFSQIACGGYGPVSTAFEKAGRQLKAGFSPAEAVEAISSDGKTRFSRQAVFLMQSGFKTGANLSGVYSSIANSAFDQIALSRESAGVLLVQKYTIALSAGVIVPFIAGSMNRMVSSLLPLFAESSAPSVSLEMPLFYGLVFYLAFLSCAAGWFVSAIDSRRERFPFYAGVVCACSLAVYLFCRAYTLF